MFLTYMPDCLNVTVSQGNTVFQNGYKICPFYDNSMLH